MSAEDRKKIEVFLRWLYRDIPATNEGFLDKCIKEILDIYEKEKP